MIRNLSTRLVLIFIIAALAIWVDLSDEIQIMNPVNDSVLFQRNVSPRLGLDLQGGLQVLLEADVPADTEINSDAMATARDIVDNRTNAYAVSENLVQLAGDRRIVGEFPGTEDTDAILDIIQQTGLLEFVDTGDYRPEEGTILQTDYTTGGTTETTQPTDGTQPETVYHTIMTGKDLRSVNVRLDTLGKPAIDFVLSSEGGTIFAQHTAANVGKILTITLDKRVISAPGIEGSIPDGQGQISGSFTAESANALAVQLRYGSLPIPLKVVSMIGMLFTMIWLVLFYDFY